MVHFNNILLFVGIASAGLNRRTYNTVLSNLQTIDADVNQLTADANGLTGTSQQALKFQNDEQALEKAFSSATSQYKTETQLTKAQCAQLYSYFKNTLDTDIQKALNAVRAKKSTFVKTNTQSIVKQDLQKLKTAFDTLCRAISSCQQTATTAECDRVDALFDAAIKDFS